MLGKIEEAFDNLAEFPERGVYPKEELEQVDPVLPDMTEEEAAEFAASIEETYGKIFLIWDSPRDDLPIGQPQAYDKGDNAKR